MSALAPHQEYSLAAVASLMSEARKIVRQHPHTSREIKTLISEIERTAPDAVSFGRGSVVSNFAIQTKRLAAKLAAAILNHPA